MTGTPSQPPKTSLPQLKLDARTYDRALSCVHCGLCLPACPTYTTTQHEADSPRGRIQMIRGMAEGKVEPSPDVLAHLDLCLDCRACETACPSEVVYHELIEAARAELHLQGKPSGATGLLRWFLLNIMTSPARLRLALLPARLMQRIGLMSFAARLTPGPFGKLARMLPPGPVWPPVLQEKQGKKMKVALFSSCVGSVMFSDVNQKAINLLAACGAEVVVPAEQACCGAIHHHNGEEHGAQDLAKKNIDAFAASGAKYVIGTVAGCGAQLREYALLLRDDTAYAEKAKDFVSRVRDVSEVLLELGLPDILRPIQLTATYHDACHLAHGQKVTAPPRKLLAKIPGLKLIPLRESDTCCGAAGTYNLTQPEMAAQLAARKLANVDLTKAEILVSANAGCTLHLAAAIRASGRPVRVLHPVEILHAAVLGGEL